MKVALVGNPNSGKTSIFNHLTGLNQRVGNYPGITVDKKTGVFRYHDNPPITLIDLPGIYSLYPKSRDEEVVLQVLSSKEGEDYPDMVIVVVDASNLERNMLLFTQVYDLGLPTILVLNMVDVARKNGITINHEKIRELFHGTPVFQVIARTGEGMEAVKEEIVKPRAAKVVIPFLEGEFIDCQPATDETEVQKNYVEERYRKIRQYLGFAVKKETIPSSMAEKHRKADKILTHPVFGYLFFVAILFMIFQAIYAWAEWPMDLIDTIFLSLSQLAKESLPDGVFTRLLAEGIIPGLGGVLIFIPQIALLFTFIFILEETGYMSRVVFIMDRLMRPFGLNGKSVVPLISGVACAIPAVMATRTIDNWKERLITIMVTPLMSCSARLPVYTLLIALVIPDEYVGPFNLKGLALMGLYLIGLFASLLAALVFKWIVKSKQKSFLVMELPLYKMPRWNSLVITIWEKIRLFVFEAGKIIMAISIILWVLASYGPGDRMNTAVAKLDKPQTQEGYEAYEKQVASVRLANSYIGIIGKSIEPAIAPLGYNWQIGIALVTSFAAREVFVGSMATIYSVGEDFEENATLMVRMRNEKHPGTGLPVYTLATGISLMLFYAFAMQCMSTLAIVLRETKSWKWPAIQLLYMTTLAYLFAWLAFTLLK
ncbi:MAG: ferrous iron transport protein B [Cyclobacteriaceae bacterium]|nr:ferrous iron transport protein B [Cyclobacteriaceae bacterium]